MIQLTEKIGSGMERDVYLHPDDDGLLVKIHKSAGNRRNTNDLEYEYYMSRIKYSSVSSYFSTIFGWEETNLGRGLLAECIRDSDGRISRRLSRLVEEGEIIYSEIRDKIELMARLSIDNALIIQELSATNILVRRNENRNECDIVVIDGFGTALRSPMALSPFKFLSRANSRRTWGRLIKNLDAQMNRDREWNIICEKYSSVLDNYHELNNYHSDAAKAYKRAVTLAKPVKFRSLEKKYDRLRQSILSTYLQLNFGTDKRIVDFGSWCLRNNQNQAVDDLRAALNSADHRDQHYDLIQNIIEKYELFEYENNSRNGI